MEILFNSAWELFFHNDRELLESNVNERCWCGALSQAFRKVLDSSEYSDYHADVEYNRNLGQIKTIRNNSNDTIPINCDLIIHSRGHNIRQDNLIAIEMKKSNRPAHEKEEDKNRLKALTRNTFDDVWVNDGTSLPAHVCGYLLGVYIEVRHRTAVGFFEFYRDGSFYARQEFPASRSDASQSSLF